MKYSLIFGLSLLVAEAQSRTVGAEIGEREVKKVAEFGEIRCADFVRVYEPLYTAQVEASALRSVISGKTKAIEGIDEKLERRFGIKQEHAYNYNPTNLTIYLMVPVEGRTELRPHHAFATPAEADEFLGFLTSKRYTSTQIEVVTGILAEREAFINTAWTYLETNFGARRGADYCISTDTGCLYEVQPPQPTKAEKRAALEKAKAKAAAERKAQEEIEERAKALVKEHERKAREEAEAKERKAREEAEAKERAEKAKLEAERKAKLEAEVKRLTAERAPSVEAARKAVAEADRAHKAAVAALESAKKDYEWARKNKKTDGVFKEKAKDRIRKLGDEADKAEASLDGARRILKAAEKKFSAIEDEAEDNVKAALKAAKRSGR